MFVDRQGETVCQATSFSGRFKGRLRALSSVNANQTVYNLICDMMADTRRRNWRRTQGEEIEQTGRGRKSYSENRFMLEG